MINDRIAVLRSLMEEKGLDAYLIPTSDFHQSEYVGDHFKGRQYMSGFTGSAGVMLVTKTEAGLWTDGRYFIQAANELESTCVTLFKLGQPETPTILQFLEKSLPENGKLGFDGRVISGKDGKMYAEKLADKKVTLSYEEDLINLIWRERPPLSSEPAFLLDVQYCGKSFLDKLADVREKMAEVKADLHILTSLDDIAWLFNLRGNDVSHNPVVLSYAAITETEVFLFANSFALGETVQVALKADGVTVKPYHDIYAYAKAVPADKTVLLDSGKVNYAILNALSAKIVDAVNPSVLMKAIKNTVEIENIRKSHLKDGVAFTKFMYWLKNNVGKEKITEISAADYLAACRKAQPGCLDLSFDTIAAYNEHAAMMHYSANENCNAELKAEGMLLVDSGGQYYEGTTDITRTIVLGEISDTWKLHFTTVVRSMMNLAAAKFLHGVRGVNLDILARGPLWELGIDYLCGTGHGIGYLLNVHEPPNGFRWQMVPERMDSAVFEAGMVTTDEPGVYIEGSHGIRIENELLCCKGEKNEYGQFMYFEPVTYAPIDLDGIDPEQLTCREKKQLNEYHQMVCEKLTPYLTDEEAAWLKHYTRAI